MADLDGDGISDILTGSWPGELYFFKGEGHGKYAASQTLKDVAGVPLKPGSASTVFACDWNGDGKTDLLMGCIEGHVYLSLGEGKMAFGKPTQIKINGQPITVGHGDSHPILADWDRDGLLDLLVAGGDGSVLCYRNNGSKTAPHWAKAQTLVPPGKQQDENKGEAKPGTRAKICVYDWNGDGWPDLLLGDFGMVMGEKPKMTAEDIKKEKEAREKMAKFQEEMQPLYQEMMKYSQAPKGEAKEAAAERQKQLQEVQKKISARDKEMMPLWQALSKFQPSYTYRGNVWVFERIPPATGRR